MFAHANTIGGRRSPIPLYSAASTGGNIGSSDAGKLCVYYGNTAAIYVSPSSAVTGEGIGIITTVPSSGIDVSSTAPFYAIPILPGDDVFANFSTATGGSTVIPATTDMGKYISLSTAAGDYANYLAFGTLSTAPTTNFAQFKLLSFDADRREVRAMYIKNA